MAAHFHDFNPHILEIDLKNVISSTVKAELDASIATGVGGLMLMAIVKKKSKPGRCNVVVILYYHIPLHSKLNTASIYSKHSSFLDNRRLEFHDFLSMHSGSDTISI